MINADDNNDPAIANHDIEGSAISASVGGANTQRSPKRIII